MTPSPPDVAGATDAELVSRVAAGDQDALAAIFDRYAGHLLAFCRSIVRNQADADDCLQDVFVVAATRLDRLRQPDRLRSWLFAVARHTCLARIQRDGRVLPTDDVADDPGPDADPAARGALTADLAAMVDDAMGGLGPRDRLVLDLADRQGLSTDEVAGALGMAAPSAHKVLVRARATARRSLGVALVARSGQGDCPELAALLGDWDGSLTPLLRKRVSRHIEHCVVCSSEEQRLAAPGALLGAGAVVAVPVGLRAGILRTAGRALGHPTGAGVGGSGGAAVGGRPGHSTVGNSTAGEPSAAAVPGSATSAGSTSEGPTAEDGWVAGWPPPYDGFGTGRNRRRVAGAAGIIAVVIVAVVLGAVQPWSGGTSVAHQATVSHRSAPPTPRPCPASSTMPPPTAAPTSTPSATGTSASTAPKARRSMGGSPPAPTATPAVGPATTIPSSSTAVPPVMPPSTTVPTTVATSSSTSSSTTTTTTTTVPPTTTTTTTTTVPVIQ